VIEVVRLYEIQKTLSGNYAFSLPRLGKCIGVLSILIITVIITKGFFLKTHLQ